MDQLQEREAKELPCTKRFMLILPGRNPFWALISPLNAKSCSDNSAEWHFLVQSIASECTGVSNWSALLLSLVERSGWSDAGGLKFPANLLWLGLLAMDYVKLRNASFRVNLMSITIQSLTKSDDVRRDIRRKTGRSHPLTKQWNAWIECNNEIAVSLYSTAISSSLIDASDSQRYPLRGTDRHHHPRLGPQKLRSPSQHIPKSKKIKLHI